MSSQIFARKLSVHNINEIIINLQALQVNELRDTIKICAADIKNDIKIITKVYDDIDRVNKRYRNILAERRYLLERCHKMGAEINELKKFLISEGYEFKDGTWKKCCTSPFCDLYNTCVKHN